MLHRLNRPSKTVRDGPLCPALQLEGYRRGDSVGVGHQTVTVEAEEVIWVGVGSNAGVSDRLDDLGRAEVSVTSPSALPVDG